MNSFLLRRCEYRTDATLGTLFVLDDKGRLLFHCMTLELPWKENSRSISCVPEGTYPIRHEWSPRFKQTLWELKGVPGRSEIKFHAGNFTYQIEGCILVGDMHLRINSDNIPDIRNSRNTLNRLHKVMEDETHATLKIIS